MLKRAFIIIGIIIFLSNNVYSLGISPGKLEMDFQPGLEQEFDYYVVNDGDSLVRVNISLTEGDFSEYVSIDTTEMEVNPGDAKLFKVFLDLPESLEKPGENKVKIIVSELPTDDEGEGTFISSLIQIIGNIVIHVPYEGQFLSSELQIGDSTLGEDIVSHVTLKNLGLEHVASYSGEITLSDFDGNVIGSKIFDGNLSAQDEIKRWFLITPNINSSGEYLGEVKIEYSDKTSYDNVTFRVGDLYIELLDYPKELISDQINIYSINVKSNWNEEIQNSFAQLNLEVPGKLVSSKSESFNIGPWKEQEIKMFVDLSGVEPGDYNAVLSLNYGDRSTIEEFKINIKDDKNLNQILFIGGALIILILITIFYLKNRNKKRK